MDMFRIEGGSPLQGRVRVAGAKNATLPIIAAALAIPGPVTLRNVPKLVDVDTMLQLIGGMGASVDWPSSAAPSGALDAALSPDRMSDAGPGSILTIDTTNVTSALAPYELVRRMRASVCVLGPLLTRLGQAQVSLPGGCNIGHRPIDLHLHGLAALGADLRIENGYVIATAGRLQGAVVDLSGPFGSTVTGTCNVLTAATTARGTTIIRGAAREPEVVDLARFLIAAGADIEGHGTSQIAVHGVSHLTPTDHRLIPDRIEAATLIIAAALTNGAITVCDVRPDDLQAVLAVLDQIGVSVTTDTAELTVRATGTWRPVHVTAEPYPGIPTDVQAQLMALLSIVPGQSTIHDGVFPDRFMHAAELARMGARIHVSAGRASIHGVERLSGAAVMASDLRASAALVLAGLAATGCTELRRVYHLDRGYHAFECKLNQLGARIRREPDA